MPAHMLGKALNSSFRTATKARGTLITICSLEWEFATFQTQLQALGGPCQQRLNSLAIVIKPVPDVEMRLGNLFHVPVFMSEK